MDQRAMDEAALLRHIEHRSRNHPGPASVFHSVIVGPGDDCAVTRSQSGELLLTTVDHLVAGRHFDESMLSDEQSLDLVARKAVARSISDIAAMGGTPAWALATGLLPDGCAYADCLFDHMHRWANHWNAPLIGGDIAFGPGPLALTVTVAGVMPDNAAPVLRSTARAGHAVYVTGPIGDSYDSGHHLRFEPRLAVGRAIAAINHAHGKDSCSMLDLSDGLGRDAARIGVASGVVLDIQAAAIPRRNPAGTPLAAAAAGEDYELLFTLDPALDQPSSEVPITRIGTVREPHPDEAPGATITDPHGTPHDATNLGWNHGG
ncbi:MAG: thiamine-phosphate kinase [Planctomycetota bacterium]